MIKFLFILFCTFFLLRLILKPILKFIIQQVVGKLVNNPQGTGFKTNYSRKKSNDNIDVDYVSPQKKYGPSPDVNAGDYIEFEEIK